MYIVKITAQGSAFYARMAGLTDSISRAYEFGTLHECTLWLMNNLDYLMRINAKEFCVSKVAD